MNRFIKKVIYTGIHGQKTKRLACDVKKKPQKKNDIKRIIYVMYADRRACVLKKNLMAPTIKHYHTGERVAQEATG